MATLYDQFGRKVDTGMLKEEQAGPTVAGLRNIYSTIHIAAGITPEKLASVLRLAEFGDPYYYLELCEDIEERDLHYSGILNTRKRAVAKIAPMIKPASESAADQKIADFVREALFESDLDLDLVSVLDSLGKGFSASEIIWDQSGKNWIPSHIKWRDPRWFMFDWIGGMELLVRTLESASVQVGGPSTPSDFGPVGPGKWGGVGYQPMTAPLLPFKFVVHISRSKAGFPIRGGLTRIAAWAYMMKIYALKDWITFAEIFGQPLRTGKYGPGATEQDKKALLRAVSRIGVDAAAIMPESMMIEFADTHATTASPEMYEKLCTYLDNSLSKLVLGQTLTTQMPERSGSRSAAQVHENVERDILTYDARQLSRSLSVQLVKPLVDLNIGPQDHYPQFLISLPDDEDLKMFGEVTTVFVDRGLKVPQKFIRDKLGIPEAAEGEDLLEPANVIGPGENPEKDEGASDQPSALSAAQKKSLNRTKRWRRY